MILIEQTTSFQDDQPRYLPVAILDAAQLREQGWTNMSPDELRRTVHAHHLYSLITKQSAGVDLFPAWQFVDGVYGSLTEVLSHLPDQPGGEIHAFWTVAVDEFNELSPAEMLAGIGYEVRKNIEKSQQQLLSEPLSARLQKVKNWAWAYNLKD